MERDHHIYDLSDAEFLNFLYAERDRQKSTIETPGINLWIAITAIIGLSGYAYNHIAYNNSFVWGSFVCYLSCFCSLLIFILMLVPHTASGKQWKSKKRFVLLWHAAPKVDILFDFIIAIVLTVGLCIVGISKLLLWLWLVFGFIETVVLCYLLVNGGVVLSKKKEGQISNNDKIDAIYTSFKPFYIVYIFTTSIISAMELGKCYWLELEMACVVMLILAIIWVSVSLRGRKTYEDIDELIDHYIYGSIPKMETYNRLLEITNGYDIIVLARRKFEKIKRADTYISKNLEYANQIKIRFSNHELSPRECNKIAREMYQRFYQHKISRRDVLQLIDILQQAVAMGDNEQLVESSKVVSEEVYPFLIKEFLKTESYLKINWHLAQYANKKRLSKKISYWLVKSQTALDMAKSNDQNYPKSQAKIWT